MIRNLACLQRQSMRVFFEPVVLNTSDITGLTAHTAAMPMYATNPSVVQYASGLYFVRITPLSYICSPVHTSVITQSQYADNSRTALVTFGPRHSATHRTVLSTISNSQDARGIVEQHHTVDDKVTLWMLHTTEVNGSNGELLGRMEARRYRVSLGVRPSAHLLGRVRFSPEGEWRFAHMEKNWAWIKFERREQRHEQRHEQRRAQSRPLESQAAEAEVAIGRTEGLGRAAARASRSSLNRTHERPIAAILSYVLTPQHVVLRCSLLTGGCARAYASDSSALWTSALVTLDDLPAYRHPPRCGTPCLHLRARHVCIGHLKTRMRRQYKSTYFQFLYALQPHPPYAVVNVSHPFRLRLLDANTTATVHRMLGRTFAPRTAYRASRAHGRPFEEEKIQFVSGLVRADEHSVLLSYGVNDCISVIRRLSLDDVDALLERQYQPWSHRRLAPPSQRISVGGASGSTDTGLSVHVAEGAAVDSGNDASARFGNRPGASRQGSSGGSLALLGKKRNASTKVERMQLFV